MTINLHYQKLLCAKHFPLQIECGRCRWFNASLDVVDADPTIIPDAEIALSDAKLLEVDPSCKDIEPNTKELCALICPSCLLRHLDCLPVIACIEGL
jgi:hypothetical protein